MPRPRAVVPRVLALAVLAAMLVAGCGGPPPGPPDPFPPRPVAIDLERLDPCALLSAPTRAELDVGTGHPATAPVRGVTTRVCGWGNIYTGYDYSVQFIPQDAAESVGAPGTSLLVVEGFGSVRVTDREDSYPLCEIVVDVNEGQLIRARAASHSRDADGAPRPIGDVCARAERVAVDAIRTAVHGPVG